jgi:hypothetical protein
VAPVATSTGTASADEDEGKRGKDDRPAQTTKSKDLESPTRHKGKAVVAVEDTATSQAVNGEKSQSPHSRRTKKSDSESEADEPIHSPLPTRERVHREDSTAAVASADAMSLLLVDDNVSDSPSHRKLTVSKHTC